MLPNPVGYNRVYVHLDEPFTNDAWFASLARGQCFVTNGPLLIVKANDQLPGATFPIERRQSVLPSTAKIELTSNDRIKRVELIQNGEVTKTVDCSDKTSQQLSLDFTADRPGWFLVRAIADVDETFRFASTAPWFVEGDTAKNRISRRSAQFFLDWVEERIAPCEGQRQRTKPSAAKSSNGTIKRESSGPSASVWQTLIDVVDVRHPNRR